MLATLLLCACVDDYTYRGASLSGEGNAFIVGNAVTTLGFRPGDPLTFTVTVQRPDSSEAGTVHLTTGSSIVTVPEAISFAKGEGRKTVTLPFQSQEATTDTVKISVAPTDASNYGITSTTYILKHYKVHHVDYVSAWFGKTWNNLEMLEAGNGNYRFTIPLTDVNGKAFQPIDLYKRADCSIYVYPQDVYAARSNKGDIVALRVVGNWKGDASRLYSDADIAKVSALAGGYNSHDDAFYLNFAWYGPNYGWWGWNDEKFYFLD